MQKITPHLWFDKQAKEATAFYAGVFENSKVTNVRTITDTPSGDCDIVQFNLAGIAFQAISAGPFFTFNPSMSFFAVFDNEKSIDATWNKLIEGGKVMMPYAATYAWANKYGWLTDKYGLSWQLSWNKNPDTANKNKPDAISPLFMFNGAVAGKTKEAAEFYTNIFPDSKVQAMVPYEKGDNDATAFTKGFIKHARFTLAGQTFMAMDSSVKHDFVFSEAISFMVNCDTQEEIDAYWSKLSVVPEAEQCGWCKDKYGVSWQIVPSVMGEMMSSGDTEKVGRVTQAFLKMKKFDIKKLEEAYRG